MLGSSFLSLADAFKFGSIIPSLMVFFVVTCIASCTMTLIAVLCDKHNVKSYRALWTKVVGPRFAASVDMVICLNSVFSCVSYCLLVGSWLTQGLSNLLGDAFGYKAFNTVIVAITCLFPLTLLRDLNALRHTSVLGVIFNIMGVGFIVWQAYLHWDERIPGRACGELRETNDCTSPEVLAANWFLPSVGLIPTFNMCASMMMAHYNVPKFYAEYSERNPLAFGRAVFTAALVGAGLACIMATAGVLRFGANMRDGNILRHFNDQFPGAAVPVMTDSERILTLLTWCVMSLNIMASFPLLFSPLRISIVQLCGSSIEAMSPARYLILTCGLLAFCVTFGLIVPSLTVVTKFKGAICGMGIAYIFPSILLWTDKRGARTPQVACASIVVLSLGTFLATYGLVDAFKSLIKAFS
jgi:amino acid permease